MRRDDCPCKGCENRKIGCHADCKSYLVWSQEMHEQFEQANKERRKENDLRAHIRNTQESLRREHHKRRP